MIDSYAKSHAVGHKDIPDLFYGSVVVEEKIDGSQFSFGVVDGELECRGSGAPIDLGRVEAVYKAAVETAKELRDSLHPGWTYIGEALSKPRHGVLRYERVPQGNIIIFDIRIESGGYLYPDEKRVEAERLGLEAVPCYHVGPVSSLAMLQDFMQNKPVLGGEHIEGIVVKNYGQMDIHSAKFSFGKIVADSFKEKADKGIEKSSPLDTFIADMAQVYGTEARYQKAFQHMLEQGKIKGGMEDMGTLIREVSTDLHVEHGEEISLALFKKFWPIIQKAVVRGMAPWYANKLAEEAFDG